MSTVNEYCTLCLNITEPNKDKYCKYFIGFILKQVYLPETQMNHNDDKNDTK